jgi:hypothetical protein
MLKFPTPIVLISRPKVNNVFNLKFIENIIYLLK